MSYNSNSSYSRTYEKRVEDAPRRIPSPAHMINDAFRGHDFPPSRIFPSNFETIAPLSTGAFDVPAMPLMSSGGGSSTYQSIRTTDDSIHVTIDVKDYKPEDIKVSVVGPHIIVEGRCAREDELGSIERTFHRKIPMPKGVRPEAVTSNLTPNGALSIVALPPKPAETATGSIPIKVQVAH